MSLSPSPLMQAFFLFQEVAKEGFDWDSPFAAARKVKEELEEVLEELNKPGPSQQQALKEEIGDLFLACSCLARHCHVEPDEAIRSGLKKFMSRYQCLKDYVNEKGISLEEASATLLSTYWQELKKKDFSNKD
ncbi:MAG TPA: MazG nucleotide pyrophosphohydrolase domain-containing protein [Alphaproteobacteria bacterium]|nr:MazG nucleotide pyrophosphohydrolase domain-containing protein [Alphaproteobacteria bacterium]